MGRDFDGPYRATACRRFNPRARMGRDILLVRAQVIIESFNPRARMGRDIRLGDITKWREWFQSTRPHGARRNFREFIVKRKCFNPRARMGRDYDAYVLRYAIDRFNPRARMGRDRRRARKIAHTVVFQSTRPHGARPSVNAGVPSSFDVSIHAPAWGATQAAV